MKYKWKKLIALSLVVCMMAMLTVGCGSSPADGNETNGPEPIADNTDTPTKQDETEPEDSASDDAESNSPDVSDDAEGNGPDVSDDTGEATEGQKQDSEGSPENAGNESKTSGKWHVYDADVAAAIDADFEGTVYKIDTDSFFIAPSESTLLDNGELLMVASAGGDEIPDEELVKVVFDNNTVFTLRDIYDGGASHKDSDASFQTIKKEVSVSLKGEFQDDVFHADAVRIIQVH